MCAQHNTTVNIFKTKMLKLYAKILADKILGIKAKYDGSNSLSYRKVFDRVRQIQYLDKAHVEGKKIDDITSHCYQKLQN